jgi:integrase
MISKKTGQTPGQIINVLAVGQFAKLAKVTPAGSLEARRLSSGVMLYWRITIDGKTDRIVIGPYDASAPPKSLKSTAKGFSIAAATDSATTLAKAHHENRANGGHRGIVEEQRQAMLDAAKVDAANAQRQAAAKLDAEKHTLKNLLTDYCDHLETLGRRSHKDARSIFKLHVEDAWPSVAALPANQVTGEQVADMMRRVLELGKGRTANKLRSYIRAAYQVALAARSKASIPLHFKDYRITSNPGADTLPDESQNNADKRPLTASELRQYWQSIKPLSGFAGAVLRLHLLTGGQRIEQLARLKTQDIGDNTITLFDGKGRPGKPARPHTVPLIAAAANALSECQPQGEYALSTAAAGQQCKDGTERKVVKGQTHISAITLSHLAVDAAVNIPGFATKRIRSGIETLLASARISSEIRGRLQSHGISGVQARHYDGHDYLAEKRHALETLFNLLESRKINTGKVVQFQTA